jgi:hypothetical protein
MPSFQYHVGLGNVGSYQVSGRPFVTSSIVVPAESDTPIEISFPSVARTIIIRNDGAATIRCGFSANGITGSATNYFTLTQNASFEQEFKVIALYLISDSAATSTATVIAGLTGINKEYLATNYSGSSGVG